MKISKTLKQIIRKEGKRSLTSGTVAKLKSSKEFSYLVDPDKI